MRGGGGVIQSTYENRSKHRKEPEKRPFTIRFLPKGASIPTKRGAYSYQNSHPHKRPFSIQGLHLRKKQDHVQRGGRGGHTSACEKHAKHSEEPEKRHFTIRFEPKGASIQTKRGTYSYQSSNHKSRPLQNRRKASYQMYKKNAHPQLAKKCEQI